MAYSDPERRFAQHYYLLRHSLLIHLLDGPKSAEPYVYQAHSSAFGDGLPQQAFGLSYEIFWGLQDVCSVSVSLVSISISALHGCERTLRARQLSQAFARRLRLGASPVYWCTNVSSIISSHPSVIVKQKSNPWTINPYLVPTGRGWRTVLARALG